MPRLYQYVGPQEIQQAVSEIPEGFAIRTPADIVRWIDETGQTLARDGSITATFVIDETGTLRVADRSSEHVACAGGRPVESAGEIEFLVGKGGVEITAVTNQSTGFCPEPGSWSAVARAISAIGMPAPESFTTAYAFRKCPACDATNVIKEGIFECAMCEAALPASWNFER